MSTTDLMVETQPCKLRGTSDTFVRRAYSIRIFFIRAKRVSNCYMQEKKKTDRLSVCLDVRLILVLLLGRQIVYGQNTVFLCLSKYIVFDNTHTHRTAASETISTAASQTEGVAAVSCMSRT